MFYGQRDWLNFSNVRFRNRQNSDATTSRQNIWLRAQLVDFKVLSLTYVDTTQNESDILTKPLAKTKFRSAATKLLNESALAYRLTIAQHTALGLVGGNAVNIARLASAA